MLGLTDYGSSDEEREQQVVTAPKDKSEMVVNKETTNVNNTTKEEDEKKYDGKKKSKKKKGKKRKYLSQLMNHSILQSLQNLDDNNNSDYNNEEMFLNDDDEDEDKLKEQEEKRKNRKIETWMKSKKTSEEENDQLTSELYSSTSKNIEDEFEVEISAYDEENDDVVGSSSSSISSFKEVQDNNRGNISKINEKDLPPEVLKELQREGIDNIDFIDVNEKGASDTLNLEAERRKALIDKHKRDVYLSKEEQDALQRFNFTSDGAGNKHRVYEAKVKNQISYLAQQSAGKELEFAERIERANQKRSQTKKKYGW
ncbi:hypothetical protein ABK040_015139 [Willaertia magna]